MDIRDVSQEEKAIFIAKATMIFDQIRSVLSTLEVDMKSDDLKTQASAVWISGNLGSWFNDFMQQLRMIEKQQNDIQQQIIEAAMDTATEMDIANE